MIKSTGKLFFGMKPSHKPIISFLNGEMFILDYLERKNGTVLPGELSSMMRDSSARTAIALRTLEQKGYIVRDIDKTDRRRVHVTITDEGRKLARDGREAGLMKMKLIIDELGEEDAAEFIRITARIIEITTSNDI